MFWERGEERERGRERGREQGKAGVGDELQAVEKGVAWHYLLQV